MQHLASRLNERINGNKEDMTRWIEDLMKRTYETNQRTNNDLKEKCAELNRRVDKEHDLTQTMNDRVVATQTRMKKDHQDLKDRQAQDNCDIRKEIRLRLRGHKLSRG